ncbi:MAG: hypothetical protein COB81_00650 [Flavobacteriaceae bacterium]|nr:MAG: hypothetical protein COB81_00650 [Flavobacteriaceae bacterium]
MFLLLSISAFSILLDVIIKDVLLLLNVLAVFILWTNLCLQIMVFSLGTYLGFYLISKAKIPLFFIFKRMLLFFICVQVLQISSPIILGMFRTETYLVNLESYQSFIYTNQVQWLTVLVLSYLNYIIPAYFIFKLTK